MATSSGLPGRATSAEGFLRAVLRSGLLGRDELQSALRGVPREQHDDPGALAEHLVRYGKLTRFQAGKLLRGISQGMVLGPYRVLAPLGKGGMGAVFLVRDTRSDQLSALKVLPPRLARTEERMLARFRREMEMSQKVAHPHLAFTYEVGEFHGLHYLAMEYIPGRTLSRLVNEEGVMHWKRAARIMAEVAAGLEHAHNQGLVHRDLKPSNIMVTPRDHAKVLDLGLALIQGEVVTETEVVGGLGYIVGSMDYIAPEQTLDAAAVDRRSDLYSLGCTLYFALSGRPPFPGGSSKDKIHRHRTTRPTAIADLVPALPPGFVGLIERLMSKEPDGRPASAIAVEEELRGWASGEVVQPLDTLEEVHEAEEAVLKEGPASEFSLVALPEVDVLEEMPDRPQPLAWPHWPIILLAASVAVMLMGGMVILVGLLAGRR